MFFKANVHYLAFSKFQYNYVYIYCCSVVCVFLFTCLPDPHVNSVAHYLRDCQGTPKTYYCNVVCVFLFTCLKLCIVYHFLMLVFVVILSSTKQ